MRNIFIAVIAGLFLATFSFSETTTTAPAKATTVQTAPTKADSVKAAKKAAKAAKQAKADSVKAAKKAAKNMTKMPSPVKVDTTKK